MGAIGWCLEVNDLALSKLAAGREKDLDFVKVMLAGSLASVNTMLTRLPTMSRLTPAHASLVRDRLEGLRRA